MCIIKSNIALLQLKEVDGPADEHLINEKYDGQEDCCFKVAKLYNIIIYISPHQMFICVRITFYDIQLLFIL